MQLGPGDKNKLDTPAIYTLHCLQEIAIFFIHAYIYIYTTEVHPRLQKCNWYDVFICLLFMLLLIVYVTPSCLLLLIVYVTPYCLCYSLLFMLLLIVYVTPYCLCYSLLFMLLLIVYVVTPYCLCYSLLFMLLLCYSLLFMLLLIVCYLLLLIVYVTPYCLYVTGSAKRYTNAQAMIFLYKRCCSKTRNIFYSLKKKLGGA